MRKVFLDGLPRWKKGVNEGKIIWKESIGSKIKFIYDGTEGEIEILDYKSKDRMLVLKYLDNSLQVFTSSFLKCAIGNLIGKKTSSYLYNEGEIIDNVKNGKLKITNQVKISGGKSSHKTYEYLCLICKNEDSILESNLKKNKGCNVCSGRKAMKGHNDIHTTARWMGNLLYHTEDRYRYTRNSNMKVDFKCLNCNRKISNQVICKIYERGLKCPACSDNLSYPEKFMYSLLEQLNENFEMHKTFNWSKRIYHENRELLSNKIYDFYIPSSNCIIETHGIQHYIQSNRGRSLVEERENDRLKESLAINNGVLNYLSIDCRYSDMKWIKESIIESKMSVMFDLSKVDWLKAHKFALNTLVKEVSRLWSQGVRDVNQISEILKLSISTVRKYLKQGTEIGWCNHTKKEI